MARRKIPIGLITHRQKRAATFAKTKESLRKKAEELSTLCGVRVALVCAGPVVPGGGGDAVSKGEVWESEEGVLAEYRALPAEARAQHAHRVYLEEEVGKERAKLARVRQDGAFPSWDAALDGITAEEARALLESIDAARAAANARREALGLPDDGNGVDDDGGLDLQQQHVPPGGSDAVVVPVGHGGVLQYTVSGSGGGGGNQMQTTPAADGINCADLYGAVPWDDTFQPHVMRTGDHFVPMDGYLWQAPGNGWPDLATGYTNESCSCNAAAMPAMYPPTLDTVHGSFLTAPAQPIPIAFSTGADFIDAPNDFLTMGLGGGFTNVDDYSAAQPQSSADGGFQLGDTFAAEPGDTQTQSQNWASFINVSDDTAQCNCNAAVHLDQMNHLFGGTGGGEPSDTQSQHWGS